MSEIGPVQLVAIGFGPDAAFEGRIMEEVAKLEEERTVRILDLLFLLHDAESEELVVLDHQGEDLGAILGGVARVRVRGVEVSEPVGRRGAARVRALARADRRSGPARSSRGMRPPSSSSSTCGPVT